MPAGLKTKLKQAAHRRQAQRLPMYQELDRRIMAKAGEHE
jgi:hypothetical protein